MHQTRMPYRSVALTLLKSDHLELCRIQKALLPLGAPDVRFGILNQEDF